MSKDSERGYCKYQVTWHEGRPEERKFTRTAAEHEWVHNPIELPSGTYDAMFCARCGAGDDV